jgi:hypothetical protein
MIKNFMMMVPMPSFDKFVGAGYLDAENCRTYSANHKKFVATCVTGAGSRLLNPQKFVALDF